MLKLIEPPFHQSHRALINSLLALLKREHDFSLVPNIMMRSTFLIASDDKNGVCGGAVLYPQKIAVSLELEHNDTPEETLIKLTSSFQPKGEEYWVARILLCLETGTSAAAILEAQDTCHQFYQDLYRSFKAFGERMGVEYLAFTLRLAETYHLNAYKAWPYQLGVAPAGREDGFVHGILSLKGKPFKARRVPKWGRKV